MYLKMGSNFKEALQGIGLYSLFNIVRDEFKDILKTTINGSGCRVSVDETAVLLSKVN